MVVDRSRCSSQRAIRSAVSGVAERASLESCSSTLGGAGCSESEVALSSSSLSFFSSMLITCRSSSTQTPTSSGSSSIVKTILLGLSTVGQCTLLSVSGGTTGDDWR